MKSEPPRGAASPSPEGSPLFRFGYFCEAVDVTCPDCRRLIRHEFSVGYEPLFYLHDRGPDRKACRLCLYRHPVTCEVIVRVIPDHLLFRDYLPRVVAELQAVAGKAGLL